MPTDYPAFGHLPGALNGHATGIILKELVRRAILAIRNERQVFEVSGKVGYSGGMTDVCTSADHKAQAVYLKSLRECFPDFGILAEEDAVAVAPAKGCVSYFTVDPLDGTKAFVRRQSHGVGTMIALLDGGTVISAYIGDINTQEIYGFRPGSERVHRISEFETSEQLVPENRPLTDRYVLLRDPERFYGAASQRLIPRFKNHEIDGGSIGTWLARLWKGEVGAAILPPGFETPWDSAPIIGISLALGFSFLKPSPDEKGWVKYDPIVPQRVTRRDQDALIVHQTNLHELPALMR